MVYIFDQKGTYGFSVEDMGDIRAAILQATSVETEETFYVIELRKHTIIPTSLDEPLNATIYAGIYRTKDTAGTELVRLGRFIKQCKGGQIINRQGINSFQFEDSDVSPLEIINMRTAFM